MLKKVTVALGATVFALSSVACSGGPSDEWCDAAREFFSLAGGTLEITGDTPEAVYAELEATVDEIQASLDDMEEATDASEVQEDIAVVKDAFDVFAETGDTADIGTNEVREAIDGIESYAIDCEGINTDQNEE